MKKVIMLAALVWGSIALGTPEIGKSAPDFTLMGSDGKTYALSQLVKDGKNVVVLEWFNPGCPYVRRHYDGGNMQRLQQEFTTSGVKWFTVASSAPGAQGYIASVTEAAKVRNDNHMNNTAILLDSKRDVARAYGAKTTPHMFVINKKGLLVYNGAIDSEATTKALKLADYKSDATITKFFENAANAAEKDKMPEKTATDPYGCSVKY